MTKPKSPLLRQRFFARRLLQNDGENASGLEIFVPLGQRLFAAFSMTEKNASGSAMFAVKAGIFCSE